ncbi:hypothetical protein L3Q82_012920, partial [Scortum barcoo]
YRLEIVGLTSTHIAWALEPKLLERGWTLHYSGVAQGERRASWCGLAYSSPAQSPCVGVHPGEARGSLPCAFGLGIGLLLLFVPHGPEQQYRVPSLLGVPGRYLIVCSDWGLHCSTCSQRSRGHRFVHNEHHVQMA